MPPSAAAKAAPGKPLAAPPSKKQRQHAPEAVVQHTSGRPKPRAKTSKPAAAQQAGASGCPAAPVATEGVQLLASSTPVEESSLDGMFTGSMFDTLPTPPGAERVRKPLGFRACLGFTGLRSVLWRHVVRLNDA